MKIAIDARNLTDTTGRYAERLINYLQEIDKENDYLILLNQAGYEKWGPKSPNFEKVLANYSLYGADGQFKLARLLYKLKPDLVHYTFQQTPLLYKGKSVITVHDLTQLYFKNTSKKKAGVLYSAKQKVLEKGIKKSTKRARYVITPTHYVAKHLVSYFKIDATKIVVTYESAESQLSESPESIGKLENKTYILYVGTAHAHKNLKRLVGAFEILKKTYPELILVFVGKKTVFHERLESYVRQKNISNVVFTGFVSDSQLSWLYKHCRAYVFPSLSEGFGLPGLEAMQNNAPVVSSDATCLPEVYGNAAHYFDPKSEPDMARAISEVLSDAHLQTRLVKNGHRQLKKYSWKRMAEETLAVYNKALGN